MEAIAISQDKEMVYDFLKLTSNVGINELVKMWLKLMHIVGQYEEKP